MAQPASPQHIAVVGAGALGLALAHGLAKRGHRVTLLEAAESIGGQLATWELGGTLWDKHYHIISPNDILLLELLSELNLTHKLHMNPTRTGFYAGGKLHSLSNILEFLRFPFLNLWEKFRLGLTILRAASFKNLAAVESITSLAWLNRWSGRTVTEKLWTPLLQSKFGEAYAMLSASFIITTIGRMFGARKGAGKQECFGYIEGGYATILAAYAAHLTRLGVEIRTSAPVSNIARENEHFVLSIPGQSLNADKVFVTAAPPLLPQLCPQLTEAEKIRFEGIPYLGIVCASLLSRQPISDFYITNILDRNVPFTGVIEMSALVDKREFGGRSLIYLPRYLPSGHPDIAATTDLRTTYLETLARMYPHFSAQSVDAFATSRLRYVMPLPTPALQKEPLPFTTSLPGLYTVSTGQITEGVLTVNIMMQLAQRALTHLHEL